MRQKNLNYDFVVVGGGFYGCCLALFLRSISEKVALIEVESELMTRASRVNQARVHTGFHYPRSFVTALRSLALHRRFAGDFEDAIVDDFKMLYAIARWRSKISANRFYRMFANMKAPIFPAAQEDIALFNDKLIEGVFQCTEFSFDYSRLRNNLIERLNLYNIEVLTGVDVLSLEEKEDGVVVDMSNSQQVTAAHVFNVTYAQINHVLKESSLPQVPLKYELAELALVSPPAELEGYGITVMDGPFFSIMPYPSENLYSLTHVRYTPHYSWLNDSVNESAYNIAGRLPKSSRWKHMVLDAQRYLPCVSKVEWKFSIYDVKALLLKNEKDDGRPILFSQSAKSGRIVSVMGSKIDNIYDLFDVIRDHHPEWGALNDRYVSGRSV